MSASAHNRFAIEFEERKTYLYAFVTGKNETVDIAINYWRRVIKECSKRGYKKLLFEEDIANTLSTVDTYTVVTTMMTFLPPGIRIAFVDRQAADSDTNAFGEDVAINRGAEGRVFATVDEAEAWLLSA